VTAWIGVDPGARFTAATLRDGRNLIDFRVIERVEDETEIGVGPRYWDEITYAVEELHRHTSRPRIAVEGVRPPNSHHQGQKKFTRPIDVMALAATFAAVLTRCPGATIVPPDGNGSGMLAGYPEELVTAGERRHGLMREAPHSSKISHARSGWDIAGEAARMARAAA
jgi:hypothetical protein